MPDSENSSASDASVAIRVAVGRLRRRLLLVATGDELSAAQISVLARLRAEGATASALAAQEGVRPQSMAATVASLEELGLVRRTPDPTDGRRQILTLTEAGQDADGVTKKARGEWLTRVFDEACTEQERQTVIAAAAILERVAAQS